MGRDDDLLMTEPIAPPPIAAVILAGGLSRRMGGVDKALLPVAGRPLLAHVLERLRPQVDTIAINANGSPERFADFGLPVLADVLSGYGGPLVGVLTALRWAAGLGIGRVICVAADTPLLPADLVARLAQAVEGAEVAFASSRGREHPTIALWTQAVTDRLDHALRVTDERRMMAFLGRCQTRVVEWTPVGADPFLNVNTPADRDILSAILAPSPT